MRKTGICTKCHHTELLEILAVPEWGEISARPMDLAMRLKGTGWLGGENHESVGRLTAYMCRKCGYTELYTADPEAVVPDGKYIFEYSGPTSTDPYR
jgi:predicted nucleic-acid-binding Zn-ribbon protein